MDWFDDYIIVAQYKYIYTDVPCQSKLQKNMQINIRECMKNQIMYYFDNVITILQQQYKMSQKLNKKERQLIKYSFSLPIFKKQYIQILPQQLENQWTFRFKKNLCVEEYNDSTNRLKMRSINYLTQQVIKHPNFDDQKYNKAENINYCRIIKTSKSKPDMSFLNDQNFDPDSDLISVRVRNPNEQRKAVVVLTDFYQHPLTIIPLLNHLKKNKIDAFCPSLQDIIYKCQIQLSYNDAQFIQYIAQDLYNIIKLYFRDRNFIFLAHGTGAILAMYIVKYFKKQCEKIVLLSPLMTINIDENENQSDYVITELATPHEPSLSYKQSSNGFSGPSGTITLTDHSRIEDNISPYIKQSTLQRQQQEEDTDQNDMQKKSESESSSEIQEVHTKRRLSIGQHATKDKGLKNILKEIQQQFGTEDEYGYKQRRQNINQKVKLDYKRITRRNSFQGNEISRKSLELPISNNKTETRERAYSALKNFMIESQSSGDSFYKSKQMSKSQVALQHIQQENHDISDIIHLINTNLIDIYKDCDIVEGHLKLFGVNKLTELKLHYSIDPYTSIYSFGRTTNKMYNIFLRELFTIFILEPAYGILQYHIHKQIFTKSFFESMKYISYLTGTKLTICKEVEYIALIGSHDCLMNSYLENIQIANDMYDNFHCRTILGCSHDLFSLCFDLIIKALQ